MENDQNKNLKNVYLKFVEGNKNRIKKNEGKSNNAHCLLKANEPITKPKTKRSDFLYSNEFFKSKANLYRRKLFKNNM